MTVRIEIRNRVNKKGMAALRMVVQEGTRRTFIPLPVKIKPAEWDKQKQQVNNKHPQAALLNRTLRQRIAETELQALKGKLPKACESKLFRIFALEALSAWEKTKSSGTLKAYRSMLKQFCRYKPETHLHEITPSWLMDYEQWCRNDGCNDAGTLKRISFIATVLHWAEKYGHLQSDPFKVYQKPKKINPERVWLTMEEISALANMQTDSVTLQHVATWFLFSCYTGLRYSDVAAFDQETSIQDGRIVLYTTKTREVVSIAITNRIDGILKQWPPVPVFSNQKCNQYLKAIAHVCKINKPITFHTARHTFAVQCANLGISQEVTSKLLGHSDLRTTGIYYKIVNERIDKEMARWG